MPNHVSTILEVRGDKKELEAFVAAIKTGKQIEYNCGVVDEYDFDLLLPPPPELLRVGSPTRIVSEEEYQAALKEYETLPDDSIAKAIGLPITQAMSDDYKSRFSADNWYDWRCANYGTKWGMYEINFGGFVASDTVLFTYDTAWSPATEYYLNIGKKFPTLRFTHYFGDEGGGFLGFETIENGVVVSSTELGWNSDEGIELRERLGMYYPEDEEESDEAE